METLAEYASRAFGLVPRPRPAPPVAVLPRPARGEILALVGPSGAGKTRALKALARAHPDAVTARPLTRRQLSRRVADLLDGPGPRAYGLLAACGLADGRLWCEPAGRLSAGEQARLSLVLALARQPGLLIVDELGEHLDQAGGRALAFNLRRLVRRQGLALAASTHRPEILADLAPQRLLELDGELREQEPPAPRELADELEFARGGLADWQRLSGWHYLGSARPGPVDCVWRASWRGRPAGVAVFSYPHLLLSARRGVLPPACEPARVLRDGAGELNAGVRLLARVVVDPRLRGCGVATRLLKFALPRLGVPVVECLAQMGDHTGFLLSAGFVAAGRVNPPRAALALARLLDRLGLDAAELMNPARRGELCRAHPRLGRALHALARSRAESGHGSARAHGNCAGLVDRALARLYAQPAYFVWRRE